ncbi:hypothetical protein ACIPSA_48825 [Streptomyces sp. NPDC086549]|uniref:hypothetical protein n=1 Tax=Streptomyces sp. NPDC086549 TaxID=3365752 RepID=UPI003817213C
MSGTMTPLPTRTVARLLLVPALAALLVAADIARPAPTTACACTLGSTASTTTPRSQAGSPTPSLALSPGAHLADPKILALTSPTPALRQAVKDLSDHSRHPGDDPSGGNGSLAHTPAGTHTASTATPTASAGAPGHAPAPDGQTPAPQPSTSAFVPAPAGPSPSQTPSPSASGGASPTPAASPTQPSMLYEALGAFLLLAALITGTLTIRRIQRRRRHNGPKTGPVTKGPKQESLSAAAAEPNAANRLNQALRTLAHHIAQQGHGELPGLRAALIGPHTVQVLPDDPAAHPHPPFTEVDAQGWCHLPADAPLLEDEHAGQVPAPYPALLPLGHTTSDTLALLNFAPLPALLLDGDPAHITQVCTALALEHAMSPWADGADLLTIGFGDQLPDLLPERRISHASHPARALQDLTERLLDAHQHPAPHPPPCLILSATTLDTDTAHQLADLIDTARSLPLTLIAPASTARPYFPHAPVLNASTDRPQHLDLINADITLQRVDHAAYQQITTALGRSGRRQQAQSLVGEPRQETAAERPESNVTAQAPAPAGHQPRSAADGPADDDDRSGTPRQPEPVGRAGTNDVDVVFPALLAAATGPPAPHLTHTGQRRSQAAPAKASTTARPPHTSGDHAHHHAPGQTDYTGANAMGVGNTPDPHAPEIRVLGPVEVDGVPHTGHGPKTAQLAALLYLRPGRTAQALCTDMDPTTPWTATTLNARLHQLRRALGTDSHGNPYVPRRRTADDPYRLHPHIRCDWTHFLHLTEHALPKGPAGLPDLEEALGLVRGKPFGPRPLPWAEPHQQEMTTRITDIAHTVATHRTPPGPHHNLTLARQAIATGLDVDEGAEGLYRAWMQVEATAGNRSGLHTAITRIQRINAALNCPLEPETEQLINELLHDSGPKPAHQQ